MKKSSVWKISVLAFGVFFCVAMVSAKATTLGDPEAGRQYAQSRCASCHLIDAGGNTSPVDEATPFQAIADTDGMTRTALVVFFRSPHPTMPNLIVRGDDIDNTIAYILSLKTAK